MASDLIVFVAPARAVALKRTKYSTGMLPTGVPKNGGRA